MPSSQLLSYRAAPELVRLHEQLTVLLRDMQRKFATSANLRVADVGQSHLVPALEMLAGLTVGVQADLATYAEQVALAAGDEGEGGVVLGLDSDTVEDLCEGLSPVKALLEALGALTVPADADAAALSKLREALASVRKLGEVTEEKLDAVVEAIQELEIEETEEPEDGEAEDDEPLEVTG